MNLDLAALLIAALPVALAMLLGHWIRPLRGYPISHYAWGVGWILVGAIVYAAQTHAWTIPAVLAALAAIAGLSVVLLYATEGQTKAQQELAELRDHNDLLTRQNRELRDLANDVRAAPSSERPVRGGRPDET